MKKQILLLLFLFTFSCFAHNNRNVHQRIVIEAYRLLKLQFSKYFEGIADIDEYIGNITDHEDYYWYNVNDLTGGADHEDRQDVVYNGGPFDIVSTNSHFWDIDHPNRQLNFGILSAESAYSKSIKYINDDWMKEFIFPGSWGETIEYKWFLSPRENNNAFLYHWYSKSSVRVFYSCNMVLMKYKFDERFDYYKNFGNGFCKMIFFNILGRLSHLLADMGVPEHARQSPHLYDHCSPYEDWLGGGEKDSPPNSPNYENNFFWTAEKVYEERGGFVNPFCVMKNSKGVDDPNLFLFYTLAQLSDWFVTYGSIPCHGNDNYNSNIGEIKSILDSYCPLSNNINCEWENCFQLLSPNNLVDLRGNNRWILTTEQGETFRDVLLPYTIRAVAGLLYRYIIEAKMQHPDGTLDRGTIYNQQLELELYCQDLSGDYYTFRAEGDPGKITVCPGGDIPITMNFFTIESRARNVTFRAANEIVFKEGFTIKAGAEMHVYLSPCSDPQQTGNCKECLDEDFNPQYNRRQ